MLVEVATRLGSGSEPVMPMPPQPASAPAASRIAPRWPDVMVVCVIGMPQRSAGGPIIANRARFVVFRERFSATICGRPARRRKKQRGLVARPRPVARLGLALPRSAPAAEAGAHRFGLAGDQAFA